MCAGSNAPVRSRGCQGVIILVCAVVTSRFRSLGMMMADTHDIPKRRRAPKPPISRTVQGSRKWHAIAIKHDRLSVRGGYNARPEAAACIQYRVGERIDTFVELDKNANWFLKGVGPPKTSKGDLKPVKVIEMIRHHWHLSLAGQADATSAVDASATAAVAVEGNAAVADSPVEDIDPMDQLEEIPNMHKPKVTAKAKAKAKAQRKKKTECLLQRRMQPAPLEVATRPPCAASDADDKTEIWIFQSDKGRLVSKRHDCGLFLRVDSIGWLLAYAADELKFQGVIATLPDGGEQSPNCDAVAGLCVEYDFGSNRFGGAWEAMFLVGELLGTQKRVLVTDLNRLMWQKLADISKVEGYLRHADYRQKKYAAKEFLILWCAALADAKPEAAELEAMMKSPTTHGTTGSLEETAVADEQVDESDATMSGAGENETDVEVGELDASSHDDASSDDSDDDDGAMN